MVRKLKCAFCTEEITGEVKGLVFLAKGFPHAYHKSTPFHPQCVEEVPALVGTVPAPCAFEPSSNTWTNALVANGGIAWMSEEEVSRTSTDLESESADASASALPSDPFEPEVDFFSQFFGVSTGPLPPRGSPDP